jgi:hypothetical protein
MIATPDALDIVFPPPQDMLPLPGGLQFKDVAPMICGVVDNGVCFDDPRVMVRLNEATKIILDYMIPVGGMAILNVVAQSRILILPPQLENVIEAHPLIPTDTTAAYGSRDTTQSWYEVVNNSTYLDPASAMDNPLTDLGLNGNPEDKGDVRRVYFYPGLEPPNATIQVTGAKRFLPIAGDEDYLIVQNIEAIKCIILSIERYENNAPDEAVKYRQSGFEILQSEIKKHIFDPRNYMLRKANYLQDVAKFREGTLGYVRAQIALDVPEALRMSKRDLTWTIQQAERRLMERGLWKDTIVTIQGQVVGGIIYFPSNVESVLAIDLCGRPIPIRSQFFQSLENGPGGAPCSPMLIDQGNAQQPGFAAPRRKYKLIADCDNATVITAVCKLRWMLKDPEDMMVIRNYEAIRLMVAAKSTEENPNPQIAQTAQLSQQMALDILDKELKNYLAGIRHTVHIQTYGFGLSDVSNWNR